MKNSRFQAYNLNKLSQSIQDERSSKLAISQYRHFLRTIAQSAKGGDDNSYVFSNVIVSGKIMARLAKLGYSVDETMVSGGYAYTITFSHAKVGTVGRFYPSFGGSDE